MKHNRSSTSCLEIAVLRRKTVELINEPWIEDEDYPFESRTPSTLLALSIMSSSSSCVFRTGLIMAHGKFIQPRCLISSSDDLDKISDDTVAKMLANFIGSDSLAVLQAKADRGDPAAMLTLADHFSVGIRLKYDKTTHSFEGRDVEKLNTLYIWAAELEYPEACVAAAIRRYQFLFPQNEWNTNPVVPYATHPPPRYA